MFYWGRPRLRPLPAGESEAAHLGIGLAFAGQHPAKRRYESDTFVAGWNQP